MTRSPNAHRCIEVLEKSLSEKLGKDSEPKIEVGFHLFGKPSTRFIGIPFTYFKRKRNGEVAKRKVTNYVKFIYCPICGEKLKGESES